MKTLTKQQYLEMCQKIAEQQYDSKDEEHVKTEWVQLNVQTAFKMKKSTGLETFSGTIDLTNAMPNEIKGKIVRASKIQVYDFKIQIRKDTNLITALYILEIWEERHKTPNGFPCKIDYPINFGQDNRFIGCEWLKLSHGNTIKGVNLDTVFDIIRWLQAVKSLTAFL